MFERKQIKTNKFSHMVNRNLTIIIDPYNF